MSSNADVIGSVSGGASASRAENAALHRKIDWTGAFWVASGVPALVLFSIGAIAATVGKPSWLVWTLSIGFGFIQAFTYAEIAGLFPHKSGGASVYGAVAWVRYSKLIAPVSVWCNWFAWSPVLAIGSGLAAGYILGALFPADAAINTWQLTLVDLSSIKAGLSLRINATFLVGVVILLAVFAIQHGGILRSARTTMVLGVVALIPLMLIALVPLLTGDLPSSHFSPMLPIARDAQGLVIDGAWDMAGITLMAGGLFIAAWSTYSFETAVCYTREFKDPKKDTFKAIFYSGLLCIVVFTLVPLAFQGHLGLGEVLIRQRHGQTTDAIAMQKLHLTATKSNLTRDRKASHAVAAADWCERWIRRSGNGAIKKWLLGLPVPVLPEGGHQLVSVITLDETLKVPPVDTTSPLKSM